MWFKKLLDLLKSDGPVLSLLVDGKGQFYLEMYLDARYGRIAFRTDRSTIIDFIQNRIPFEHLLKRSPERLIYIKSTHFYVPAERWEIQDIPIEYAGYRYCDFRATMRQIPEEVYRQLAEI